MSLEHKLHKDRPMYSFSCLCEIIGNIWGENDLMVLINRDNFKSIKQTKDVQYWYNTKYHREKLRGDK